MEQVNKKRTLRYTYLMYFVLNIYILLSDIKSQENISLPKYVTFCCCLFLQHMIKRTRYLYTYWKNNRRRDHTHDFRYVLPSIWWVYWQYISILVHPIYNGRRISSCYTVKYQTSVIWVQNHLRWDSHEWWPIGPGTHHQM